MAPLLLNRFTVTKEIEYLRRGDRSLAGDLYRPRRKQIMPAVLMIHGGSWANGDKWHMTLLSKRLARNGFVVFNVNYRLAPEFPFPAGIEDCEEALRWMVAHSEEFQIDPSKISVWGFSAGAHMAAMVGVRSVESEALPPRVKIASVVGGSGPYNLSRYPDDPAVITYLGENILDYSSRVKEASPVLHVTQSTPPMFLYHGTRDRVVCLSHTREMHSALNREKVKNRVHLMRGLGHVPAFVLGQIAHSKAIRFLKSSIRNPQVSLLP